MDAEIAAMSAIVDALENLDAEARARVLHWAGAKYSVKVSSAAVEQNIEDLREMPENDSDQDKPSEFETFADLYSESSPAKDPEKVLVAAYWHQVIKGKKELTSAQLNKDLANLGHKITNINVKFNVLIGSKPQLALQIKKSGSTKQARKKYKLTQAGIAKVQGMLAS